MTDSVERFIIKVKVSTSVSENRKLITMVAKILDKTIPAKGALFLFLRLKNSGKNVRAPVFAIHKMVFLENFWYHFSVPRFFRSRATPSPEAMIIPVRNFSGLRPTKTHHCLGGRGAKSETRKVVPESFRKIS